MSHSIKRILVTGSSGTIGTHLSLTLLSLNYDVIGVDKRPNVWSKSVQDITLVGDLCDLDWVMSTLPADVDLVIHLAANPRVYNLVLTPSLARDNFDMLFNCLEYVRQHNIPRFMFSSSREVYGNSEKYLHSEQDAYVRNCESPYTATKIGGEALVHAYRQCYGVQTIIFRFSNVYGKYDDSDRVIPLFVRKLVNGEDITVFGKDKCLDFTYIEDAIQGVVAGIYHFESAKNKVFNLSGGEGISIYDVGMKLIQLLNSEARILCSSNRTGEVVKYVADITRAKEMLKYCPTVSIDDGLRKTVDWMRKEVLL